MALFPTTRWTLVLEARAKSDGRRKALDELLRIYWRPLYVLARKSGLLHEAASDAVQAFAEHLLSREFAERLDPERGRMRSFLRRAFSNHLATSFEHASAQKRGGGAVTVGLDSREGEALLETLPENADDAFDREWRHVIFERAFAKLRSEFESGDRHSSFAAIESFFLAEGEPPSYQELAASHALSVPQLKSALHRSRSRLRELVLAEIADTVAEREHVAFESQAIFAELSP